MENLEKNKYYLILIGLCIILFTICIIQGQKLKEYRNGGLTDAIDSTAIAVDTTVAIEDNMAADTAAVAVNIEEPIDTREYTNTGDYSNWTIAQLEPKALEGDVNVQLFLGKKYYDIQDYTNALSWFLEADKKGDSMAQFNIGYLYYEGKGVNQDTESAKQWFLKSAKQGNENAIKWLKDEYGITDF